MTKYCKRDFGIKINILSRQLIKTWVKFVARIETVFKWTGGETRLREGREVAVWVRQRDLRCRCPKLRKGHSYLVVGFNDIHEIRKGIVVSQRTVVDRWNSDLQRRVKKFERRQKRGVCKR